MRILKYILVAILFCASSIDSVSQGITRGYNSGSDFYVSFVPGFESYYTGKYVRLFIASAFQTPVTVSNSSKGFFVTKMTKANGVIEIDLPTDVAQPLLKVTGTSIPSEQVYPQSAVRVTSSKPITLYGVYHYLYSSDSFIAIPISSLGTEYIISTPIDFSSIANNADGYPSECNVIATEDNTIVKFTMGGNKVSKTVGGLATGDTVSFTMNAGDVWCVANSSAVPNGDLTGSKIESNHRVAVVTGNQCANVPVGNKYCDYTIEMELPTLVWGTEFIIPKNGSRLLSGYLKICPKDSVTHVYKNGILWKTLLKSGTSINNDYQYERIDSVSNESVYIETDSPVSITFYNQGSFEDGVSTDPYQMVIYPTNLFFYEAMFETPNFNGIETFKTNYVSIVYKPTSQGTIPDDLVFGYVDYQFHWIKVSDQFGPYIGESVGGGYAVKELMLPAGGTYRFKSDSGKIGVYSYGGSDFDSYGNLISGTHIRYTDTIKPTPNYFNMCDGSVIDGVVGDFGDNHSNMSQIYLDNKSTNYLINTDSFVSGETQIVKWRAFVLDKTKNASAIIHFIDAAGNDSTVIIKYYADNIVVIPNSLIFGLQKYGNSTAKGMIVKNQGSDPVKIVKAYFKNGTRFSTNISLPLILDPSASSGFLVIYDAVASSVDTLVLETYCGTKIVGMVSGVTGFPRIDVSNTCNLPISFDSVSIGDSSSRIIRIYNRSDVSLVVKSMSITNVAFTANFPSSGVTIAPRDSFSLTVKFKPMSVSAYVAKVIFSSDAQKSDSVVCMYGIGYKPEPVTYPVIGVSNPCSNPLVFGNVRIGKVASKSIAIYNHGTDTLIVSRINGVTGTFNVVEPEFYLISIASPLIIPPDSSKVYTVRFFPSSNGSSSIKVSVISNAKNSDSILCINGIGVTTELNVGSLDFGYKRIRNGSYNLLADWTTYAFVTFENVGTDTVVIDSLLETTQDASYTFGYLSFPVVIPPFNKVSIPVTFSPSIVGKHLSEFTVFYNEDKVAFYDVLGYGKIPRFTITDSVDFGMTNISTSIPNYRVVCIRNLKWEFGDTLSVFDVMCTAEIDTSASPNKFGTEGFRFNKSMMGLNPRYVIEGDSILFIGSFLAPDKRSYHSTMQVVTDGEGNPNSYWYGGGYSDTVYFSVYAPSKVVTCVNNAIKIPITAVNDSDSIVTKLTVLVEGDDTFSCDSVFDLQINPKDSGRIYVTYLPRVEGEDSVKIRFWANNHMDYEKSVVIYGTAVTDSMSLSVSDVYTSHYVYHSRIPIMYKFKMDTLFEFSKLHVVLKIDDPTLCHPDPNDLISIPSLSPFKSWVVLNYTVDNGIITVDLEGTPFWYDQKSGVAFFINVLPLLGNSDNTMIHIVLVETDNKCVEISTKSGIFYVNPPCAGDSRRVVISETNFSLSVVPNPVNNSHMFINFGVGVKSDVKIYLFNDIGSIVDVVADREYESGLYAIEYSVNDLAGGEYTIYMESEGIVLSERVVIKR